MKIVFTKPWLKALSGLFINFSAAYFALAFITSIFSQLDTLNLFTLTKNILLGIVFLLASVKTEEILENYD